MNASITNPYSFIKNSWYVAGLSSEFVKRELKGMVICRQPVVIWRNDDGQVNAFDNRCVHKRFPLSEGKLLDDGTLQCAYHGLCYDSKGTCVDVPSHPGESVPSHAKLRRFPVVEQDGVVWIWSGDQARAKNCRPPRTPEIAEENGWETAVSAPMTVPANYLLLIENLLDVTHFYPLHDGNVGDRASAEIPINFNEGEEDGNYFVETIREANDFEQPPFLKEWFGYDVVDRVHTHRMASPGLTRVQMRVSPPGKLGGEEDRSFVVHHTHTPIDERNHVWRWTLSMDGNRESDVPGVSMVQKAAEMFPSVVAQDLWALEKQQEMFEIPDGDYNELFLSPDFALRRARGVFLDMLNKELPAD